MKTLIEFLLAKDSIIQFNLIPGRIFLDTNVLQYLQDFDEYIFDNYRENEEKFQTDRKTIYKGERLFNEVVALHDFFIYVNRANFEFALSESVFREVIKKKDSGFIQWFYDVWDHWDAVVSEYKFGETFSQAAESRYKQALNDKSLSGGFSHEDFNIILDAIRFDCNALLTVDRFARDQNKKLFVFKNYKLMVLSPSELVEIMKPYRSLL